MPSVLASRPCSCQHLLPFATLALESDFSVAPADGARRTPSEKEGERVKESRGGRECVCLKLFAIKVLATVEAASTASRLFGSLTGGSRRGAKV